MITILNKVVRCFCIILAIYCICLGNNACQHIKHVETIQSDIVDYNSSFYSVFDIDRCPIVPCHLNADITLTDSTIRIQSKDSLYSILCRYLGLSNPIITIFGYKDIANMRLVKIHVEDNLHNHLYVLLFDDNGHIIDSVYIEEPINGDQLGYEEGIPIEWHYYSNFYFHNGLEKKTISCDLKRSQDRTDTLYSGFYLSKYRIIGNKFVECSTDSSIKGIMY